MRFFKMRLTLKQKEAMDKLIAFMKDRYAREFQLQGYAGAGKTYVITSFVKLFPDTKFVFATPTHKAAAVIKKMLKEKGLNYEATTIHKILQIRWSDRKRKYYANKLRYEFTDKVLILDEAEMLIDEIYEIINRYKYFDKVIFVGDPAQLPPVGGNVKLSKAIQIKNPKYGVLLDQVVRTGDNYLLQESMYVRKHGRYSYVTRLKDGIGVEFVNNQSIFLQKFVDALNEVSVKENPYNVRIVTGTNKKVVEYNHYARSVLFGEKAEKEEFIKGDILMGYGNYGDIKNGFDYLVLNVEKVVANWYKFDIDMWKLRLLSLLEDKVYEVLIPTKDARMTDFVRKVINDLRKERPELREVYLQDLFKSALIGDKVYTVATKFNYRSPISQIQLSKTISYGYALTIHKAIGSTYDMIFINDIDIDRFPSEDTRIKARYVAVTRAKNLAIIYSNNINDELPNELAVKEVKMIDVEYEVHEKINLFNWRDLLK